MGVLKIITPLLCTLRKNGFLSVVLLERLTSKEKLIQKYAENIHETFTLLRSRYPDKGPVLGISTSSKNSISWFHQLVN